MMVMILLGTYVIKNRENLVFYSPKEGKCRLFQRSRGLDTFLYSYFNKVKIDVDKYNNIVHMESLGPCNIEHFLENIKFASNNLKTLNAPKVNNIIIYLEDINGIMKSNQGYILKFSYIRDNYKLEILDDEIISYLYKSKENLDILNKYIKNSKVVLVIRKNRIGQISIIKMHSIKMGMSL